MTEKNNKMKKIKSEIERMFDAKDGKGLRYLCRTNLYNPNDIPLELRLLAGKLAIDIAVLKHDWDELNEIRMQFPPSPDGVLKRATKEYVKHGEEIVDMHVQRGDHFSVKAISTCSNFSESIRNYARERIYDAEIAYFNNCAEHGLWSDFIVRDYSSQFFSERAIAGFEKRLDEVAKRNIERCTKLRDSNGLCSILYEERLSEEIRIEAGERAMDFYLGEKGGYEELFYFSLNAKLPEEVRIKAGERYIDACIYRGDYLSLFEFKDLTDFLVEGKDRVYCPGNPPPRRKYRELMADLTQENVPEKVRQKLNSDEVRNVIERKDVREAVYWSRYYGAICF